MDDGHLVSLEITFCGPKLDGESGISREVFNKELQMEIGVELVNNSVEWQWLKHSVRKHDVNAIEAATSRKLIGKRPLGGPKKKKKVVEKDPEDQPEG